MSNRSGEGATRHSQPGHSEPGDPKPNAGPDSRRRWIRRVLLCWIALLYLVSVPWYRAADDGETLRMIFGLPDWVAVALACYVAAAFLNAGAWLLTDLRDGPAAQERAASAAEEPPA